MLNNYDNFKSILFLGKLELIFNYKILP